jgi:hypothetical protein
MAHFREHNKHDQWIALRNDRFLSLGYACGRLSPEDP